jgi:hypothetical protein
LHLGSCGLDTSNLKNRGKSQIPIDFWGQIAYNILTRSREIEKQEQNVHNSISKKTASQMKPGDMRV